MNRFYKIIFFVFALLPGCNPGLLTTAPLIPKDMTYKSERKNNLFVFVGEKIALVDLPYEKGSMDGGFKATYKILQRVYGNYSGDIIEFTAYDHYGIPAFSKYKYVMLYVSKFKDGYYHQKYMYNDVYMTTSGRWAGSYSRDYEHSFNEHTTVKPEKIDFVEEVSYPVREDDVFPEPYFKIVGDRAIAVYGNYIEDLFKLKKDGFLTARGLFGKDSIRKIIVQPLQLEEVVDSTKK